MVKTIYDLIKKYFSKINSFLFPSTVEELIIDYGPINIKILADLCLDEEMKLYLLEQIDRFNNEFKDPNEDLQPICSRLRDNTYFYIGQVIVVIGNNRIFDNVYPAVVTDIDQIKKQIEVSSFCINAEDQVARQWFDFISWHVSTFEDFWCLRANPRFVSPYLRGRYISPLSNVVPEDKVQIEIERMKSVEKRIKDELLATQKRLANQATVLVRRQNLQVKGIFFADGMNGAEEHSYIRAIMTEDDGRTLTVSLERPYYDGGKNTIGISSICGRFIVYDFAMQIATDDEAFGKWAFSYSHRPSRMTIASDYRKSVMYVNGFVLKCDEEKDVKQNVSLNDFIKYCFDSQAALRKILKLQ